MDLHTISYASVAVRIPSAAQIAHLLQKARARNEEESVTGVLLYSAGTFHQYLEGPEKGLDRVYAAILRDPMHHHIFEIVREPIERREFPNWTMGYRGLIDISDTSNDAELTAKLADESIRLTTGRLLLNAFWNQGLGARYQAALSAGRPLG